MTGADFVIQVRGLEPWRLDMQIPTKYGVIQEVDDTMGPDGKDMQPKIRELVNNPKVYAADGVRCEVLNFFGFWCSENHWHCSDYLPYFRKNEEMINHFLPQRWDLLALEEKVHSAGEAEIDTQLAGIQKFTIEPNMLNAPK